jgi:hypothetical protein
VNRTMLTRARDISGTTDADTLRSRATRLAQDRDAALALAEEEEDRANTLFAQREIALAELAERDQRVLYLDNQVRALRRRLVDIGRPADAFLPAEIPPTPPATFADLLDWAGTTLSRLEFTGDSDASLNLDHSPESSTWVRSSWEVMRAMQSYADAKSVGKFHGDFRTWCESSPEGAYVIPAAKVARDESETVRSNTKWRRQREFPVPTEIYPSGRLFMGAHVRIGASAGGQISPRLHFHDATSQTGMIYVGYLGRHLTNTRT